MTPRKPRNFIRQWRQRRKLTLIQLAERIGMTHGSLSRIERGLQPYNQILLEAIATELQCEPVDLLIRDPSDPEGIWSIWDTLDPPQKRQAVDLIKVLKRTGTDG